MTNQAKLEAAVNALKELVADSYTDDNIKACADATASDMVYFSQLEQGFTKHLTDRANQVIHLETGSTVSDLMKMTERVQTAGGFTTILPFLPGTASCLACHVIHPVGLHDCRNLF